MQYDLTLFSLMMIHSGLRDVGTLTVTILYKYLRKNTAHFNLFILSNLDTHIQYSVVLLDKIPLHVSGWLAHHQEVQICTVHAAN